MSNASRTKSWWNVLDLFFFWVPNIWGISYWGDGMELISSYQLLLNHTKPIYILYYDGLLLLWMPSITSYNVQFEVGFPHPQEQTDDEISNFHQTEPWRRGEAPRFSWGPIAWKIICTFQWEISRIRFNGGTLVPYVWPYFGGISPYIGLKNRPYLGSWNGHWTLFFFSAMPCLINYHWFSDKNKTIYCRIIPILNFMGMGANLYKIAIFGGINLHKPAMTLRTIAGSSSFNCQVMRFVGAPKLVLCGFVQPIHCCPIYIYINKMYYMIWRFNLKCGTPSHHGCFNTKSWSCMTWMIWGTPILGNHHISTTNPG